MFVQEQGVDESLEMDDKDTEATHLLLESDGEPIGTARVRFVDDGTAKVERVAVREDFRGNGFGRRLMEAAEGVARDAGAETVVLHAQRRVEEFYDRLGYSVVGDEFDEAGIPHVAMEKDLSDDLGQSA